MVTIEKFGNSNSYIKICFIAVFVAMMACSSSNKSSDKQTASGETATTEKMEKNDSSDVNIPPPDPGDQLAPGTAKVRLSVQASESEDGDKVIWNSMVEEVLGYGSATPPIGSKVALKIDATTYFKNTGHKSGDYAERDTMVCIISHRTLMKQEGRPSPPEWTLEKIVDNGK